MKASLYKKRKKKLKVLVITVLLVVLFWAIYGVFVNPIIIHSLEMETNRLITSSINNAIENSMHDSGLYENLIQITYDANGKVNLIQARAYEINKIGDQISTATEKNISTKGETGIPIAIGGFTGLSIFTGKGPKVNIKALPVGSVLCSFTSSFESAGINQTRHKIYINVEAKVGVVLPFHKNKFFNKVQVLICENIFIGEVPEVYFGANSLQSLLNFVP